MDNKSRKILAEVSAGELLDKISILEIKCEKIKDTIKLNEVKKEYTILLNVAKTLKKYKEVDNLYKELKTVNLKLWHIEDEIRIKEKNKDFKKEFVDLARNVYLNNDKRAEIKNKINKLYGSNIREVKEYVTY